MGATEIKANQNPAPRKSVPAKNYAALSTPSVKNKGDLFIEGGLADIRKNERHPYSDTKRYSALIDQLGGYDRNFYYCPQTQIRASVKRAAEGGVIIEIVEKGGKITPGSSLSKVTNLRGYYNIHLKSNSIAPAQIWTCDQCRLIEPALLSKTKQLLKSLNPDTLLKTTSSDMAQLRSCLKGKERISLTGSSKAKWTLQRGAAGEVILDELLPREPKVEIHLSFSRDGKLLDSSYKSTLEPKERKLSPSEAAREVQMFLNDRK